MAKAIEFVEEYNNCRKATDAAKKIGIVLAQRPNDRWYVYMLIDPRADKIFYVGKGTGKRCHCHVKAVRRGNEHNAAKASTIFDIEASGHDVVVSVFCSFADEGDAIDCERELIVGLPNLTNIAGGRWSAKELAREKSRYMLARMRPMADWLSDISDELRESITKAFGSPEVCYERLESGLRAGIIEPEPNTLIVGYDGKHTLCWEPR